ncbi:MAG: DUF1330 domain-containing protein [Pseudomonadota bacterium]|nr:DUF1330 domain-containing protein [Pseudomonadota bacterium]
MSEATAKGYVYVEVEVLDPEGYRREYMSRSGPAVAAHGGRFLVRGGDAEVLNGPDDGRRRVMLEFDSYERALEFARSDIYAEAKVHRDRYAKVLRFVVMRGAG